MKIYYYVVFTTLLIILFFIAGFQQMATTQIAVKVGIFNLTSVNPTPSVSGVTSTSTNLSLWSVIALLFIAGGAATAVVGLLTGVNFAFLIKGAIMMTPLTALITDLISILFFVSGWVYWVILAIIAPLVVGYVIALTEFWEGRD
jgi:hypothetical protein